MEPNWKSRKVVIIGAGAVGSTFAYALAQHGTADQIVLLDKNRDYVQGQVLDLAHGLPFYPPVQIRIGSQQDYRDAQVIVITAGAKQAPGETRLALLKRNASIIESIMDDIVSQGSSAVVLVTSNPVDILTSIALKRSGWPKGRVIGSGTVLDSARFRYLLSQHCGVAVSNIHAYFLGEHGDSEFPAWSMTHIGGIAMADFCPICNRCQNWDLEKEQIVKAVRDSAYHIINYKGATYFAIGVALVRIVGTILQDQNSILTVSTLLEGEYGVEQVCLGIPAIVGKNGVREVIKASLSLEEQDALRKSAETLKIALREIAD
jgi:L-lactate dehydrogenase